MNRLLRVRTICLFIAASSLAACGVTTSLRQEASETSSFVRDVYPFPVIDADGQTSAHPFFGGFNVPRPQAVDIDGDEDLDLFVQEYPGMLTWFEQVASNGDRGYVWRTDTYANLEPGDWYRFVDIDSDGDLDLLTERRYSHIRFYRNEGTQYAPDFVIAEDSLRDVNGKPIFSDRQNNPTIADVDCDRMPDLFIGRLDGTVTRYEVDHFDEQGIPRFELVTDRFENIEIVAQFGSLHGANGLAFYDFDADGDLDFFWGDFFEAGLLLIRNTGTCEKPNLRGQPVRFPLNNPITTSGYNVPFFADVDGDADNDLLVGVLGGAFNPTTTAHANLYYLENPGGGRFELRTRRFIDGLDFGTETFVEPADLDGDGDYDLLVSNKIDPGNQKTSLLFRLENTGSRQHPSYVFRDTLGIEPYYHYAPALGDLDGDGDLDMLLGTWNKGLALYRNEGSSQSPAFAQVAEGYVEITRGSNTTPALGDVDGDGDLDLFIGESSGTINFYRNVGDASRPTFELVSDEFLGIDVDRRSVPELADIDRDGDLDLFIGSESGETFLYRNTGSPDHPVFEADSTHTLQLKPFATPAFVDVDGDGDQDLIAGTDGGGLVFYEHFAK